MTRTKFVEELKYSYFFYDAEHQFNIVYLFNVAGGEKGVQDLIFEKIWLKKKARDVKRKLELTFPKILLNWGLGKTHPQN